MPNGSAQEWEEDWRKGVNTRLESLSATIQQFITEVRSRLSVVENTQSDMRQTPRNARDWLNFAVATGAAVTAGCGCIGTLIFGALSVLVAVAGVLVLVFK